jgi:predicted nuclease of predicted toxin-antitoxin system
LAMVSGFPPKVILIRGKNLLTTELGQFIITQIDLIKTFLSNSSEGLLELHHRIR